MAYTTQEIINIAKVSQYLCDNEIQKRGLAGGGIDLQLPKKIYTVRKDVEWQLGVNPSVEPVNATATITITDIGSDEDKIKVSVDDPDLGLIELGEYEKQSSDTDTTILATSMASDMDGSYGYGFTSNAAIITIEARIGLGAEMNLGNRLIVKITNARIFDITFDNTFN